MRGVKAVDRIVELCERDIAFIWLSKGEKPKRDAFYDFINNRLTGEVLEDLHYQFIRRLEQKGIESFIKLQTHDKMKTRAYKKAIGQHYNMKKIEDGDKCYCVCSDNRQLIHQRTEVR